MSPRAPWREIQRAMGFRSEELALMARLPLVRLRELEAGAEPLADEADRLGALLGVDMEALMEGANPSTPLAALLKGQAADLDAGSRFLLAEAMSVAREIQALRGRLGRVTGLGPCAAYQSNNDYGHPKHGTPERLAQRVRDQLGLSGPVRSVTEQLLVPLGVDVLWAPLPESIDAVAMATPDLGAVIVANPDGVHMRSVGGRRVAFTHELCHILFDRNQMSRFARACRMEGEPKGQEREWFERVERRARAFALALLAPRLELMQTWNQTTDSEEYRVQAVIDRFGIGYLAARAHLHNNGLLPLTRELSQRSLSLSGEWEYVDARPPVPTAGSSWLRSGVLTQLCQEAEAQGLISSRRARELQRGPLRAPEAWSPHTETIDVYATSSMGLEGI